LSGGTLNLTEIPVGVLPPTPLSGIFSTPTMSQQTLVEGKYTLKSLMDTAERVVKEKTLDTMILDVEAENRIPKFRSSGEQP
jgi:hypothetical protein